GVLYRYIENTSVSTTLHSPKTGLYNVELGSNGNKCRRGDGHIDLQRRSNVRASHRPDVAEDAWACQGRIDHAARPTICDGKGAADIQRVRPKGERKGVRRPG